MKRRKERLHTYVVKSEKVAPDVLETPWIGSSKYEVSFLYARTTTHQACISLYKVTRTLLAGCPNKRSVA